MASKTDIFITGGTGYIGGTVVAQLLKHANAASFDITVLVRSAEKAAKLKTLGLKTVLGSYTEKLEVLTQAVSQADVVITIADSDNLAAAQAILDGMKIKHEKSGKAPILIHTSGTAFLIDDARGLHANHRTYSDLESDVLNAIPETALHRNVDSAIINADTAGYIKAYIITPGTVFGTPSGPLVELGVQNTHSIQMPYIIKPSIIRKKGSYFGKGLNQWPAVDVRDVADLFVLLLNTSLDKPDSIGHGLEGYYFAENMHYSLGEAATAISEELVARGVATTVDPGPFTPEECEKYYGAFWALLATNCYAKADRSRAIGWAPKYGKADFLADLRTEVAFYVQEAEKSN